MAMTRQIPVQIKTPTAVYAAVGAGDLVVERIRAAQVEGKNMRSQVSTFPTKAQAVATERLNAVVSDIRALPEQVRTLPLATQARVQAGVAAALGQASETYGGLAKRGERLVSRIRRQESTLGAVDAAKTTTSRAKATTTTAKKAAKETTTRAKAARTTAQKTASAATKATTDAAKKVGDTPGD
jgi:valyl-tRNA synthetase